MQVTGQRAAPILPMRRLNRPADALRQRIPVTVYRAVGHPSRLSCHAAPQKQRLSSAWVDECLKRAQQTVVTIGNQQYIPLSEAQRWFVAGVHEAEEEQHEQMDEAVAERTRLQGQMQHVVQDALREHSEHEVAMSQLLHYAVAIERELEHSRQDMQEAAQEAARQAEERLTLQYQQLLLDYEHSHEAEHEAVMASMQGQVNHLKNALKAAHEAKKHWRDRALQVEQQFARLRGMIESSLQAASGAASIRRQAQAQELELEAPSPTHPSPRIRSSEEVPPADADVAVHHQHANSAPGTAPHRASAKSKKHLI